MLLLRGCCYCCHASAVDVDTTAAEIGSSAARLVVVDDELVCCEWSAARRAV